MNVEIKEEKEEPENKEQQKDECCCEYNFNEQIEYLEKEKADLLDALKRLQAEHENFRKRVERDKAEFVKTSKKDVILNVLPILDNLELALKSCKKDSDYYKGFELIYSQFVSVLEKEGVKQINQKEFSPELHEPLLQEETDEDGKILEVLQKGYYLHDKVLRTAKVKISKLRNSGK